MSRIDTMLEYVRTVLNRVFLPMGLFLASKKEFDLIAACVRSQTETIERLGKELETAYEEANGVVKAIRGSGATVDPFDKNSKEAREYTLGDRVSQALESLSVRADAAERRYGKNEVNKARDRVDLMVAMIQRMAIAVGFTAADRPTEEQVVQRIEAQSAALKRTQDLLVVAGKPELIHEPEYFGIRSAITGLMYHWFLSALDGELGSGLEGEDTVPPAPNYLSFVIGDGDKKVEVLIQRATGQTPAALKAKLEQRLTTLMKALDDVFSAYKVDPSYSATQALDDVREAALAIAIASESAKT